MWSWSVPRAPLRSTVLTVRPPFSCPQILDVNQSHDATCLPSPSSDNDGHAECPSPTLPGQPAGELPAREEVGREHGSPGDPLGGWDISGLRGLIQWDSALSRPPGGSPLSGIGRLLCRECSEHRPLTPLRKHKVQILPESFHHQDHNLE